MKITNLKVLFIFVILVCSTHLLSALSISGKPTVCPGEYTTYTLSVSPPPQGYGDPSIEWAVDNGTPGSSIGGTSLNVTWSRFKTTGSVRAWARYPKIGGSAIYSENATVLVSILLSYNPGAISGPTFVQCGDQTPRTYSIAPVTNANYYNWSLPPGWTYKPGTCSTCNQITVIPPTYCSSGKICVLPKNTWCGYSDALNYSCMDVINHNPDPDFTATLSEVCTKNSTHDYTVSVRPITTGNGYLTNATGYLWTVTGGNASFPGSVNGPSAVIRTNANVTNYITVTLTAYFPFGKSTQRSFPVSLTDQIPGAADLDGDYMGCASGASTSIHVLNTPTNYHVSYRWTWSPTGGIKVISAGAGATVIPTSPGMYNIYATSRSVCGSGPRSDIFPYDVLNCAPVATAVEDVKETPKEISFYPNPANNSFELIIPSKGTAQVKLISLTGQVVKQFQVQDQQTTINVADVTPGLYILNVVSNEETLNKQIEIVK